MTTVPSFLNHLRKRAGEKFWIFRALCRRKLLVIREWLSVLATTPQHNHRFCIVSCERNAGPAAVKCLESVHRQRYNRLLVRHIFIDDASDDGTHELVREWLQTHPDHSVQYIHHETRQGGTANTVNGFRLAQDDDIVIELNGDDWLEGRNVLRFLNRIYAVPDVWMTYNTLRYENSIPALWARPYPRDVIECNGFRDQGEWISSHPHTFRKRLFDHLREETFYDPKTNDYWESADDQAIYLAMLELSGFHSRHLHRALYVYNFREMSHCFYGSDLSEARSRCIRQQPRYLPLESL